MKKESPRSFNEHRWVVQIRRQIEEALDDDADADLPVSIFNVPKPLMAAKPEAYIPQQVAIGPYHHRRPELYEMERYKLSSARWVQKSLRNIKFQAVVEHFTKLEHRIRSSYHRYVELNGETLAWMMAVDASFLLEYLNLYAVDCPRASPASARMSHLIDCTGRKAAHGATSRDIVMLENQIPLFLLAKLLEFQCASPQESERRLLMMLIGFCKELSPFRMVDDAPQIQVTDQGAHLLQVLYDAVVPPAEITPESGKKSGENVEEEIDGHDDDGPNSNQQKVSWTYFRQFIGSVWNRTAQRLLPPQPVKLIVIPWKVLRNLPVFALLRQPIDGLLDSIFDTGASGNVGKQKVGEEDQLRPPLAEELEIPSAAELKDAGVTFRQTTGGLISIRFDSKSAAFFLPIITVDANTEVIMRNLVAYEASATPGPLVLTRYTELMNGIIDGEEDVRVLREEGIVCNHLKSDVEAACMWNGMSRSVRLTRVKHLDKVIQEVNRYYHGSWKVRTRKFMGRYVFASWQLLTLLAAVLLLLMMAFQAFCLVYGCSRLLDEQKAMAD
ncbi:putative UPF0481 protein At3g02645 [Nymphaea colorata]|uniref:Uncharacterized protein n=1 Tax=Nymphaea colorata TaxID=210225 RepID=A0A5K1CFF2_9MAGN|nr:putative UPF0481 protein At3g02645 [Nymphaea colorata]